MQPAGKPITVAFPCAASRGRHLQPDVAPAVSFVAYHKQDRSNIYMPGMEDVVRKSTQQMLTNKTELQLNPALDVVLVCSLHHSQSVSLDLIVKGTITSSLFDTCNITLGYWSRVVAHASDSFVPTPSCTLNPFLPPSSLQVAGRICCLQRTAERSRRFISEEESDREGARASIY